MPFTLIDLDTFATFGPFPTHAEARQAADKSELRTWSIYCDGDRVESKVRAALGWLHEDIAVVVPQERR